MLRVSAETATRQRAELARDYVRRSPRPYHISLVALARCATAPKNQALQQKQLSRGSLPWGKNKAKLTIVGTMSQCVHGAPLFVSVRIGPVLLQVRRHRNTTQFEHGLHLQLLRLVGSHQSPWWLTGAASGPWSTTVSEQLRGVYAIEAKQIWIGSLWLLLPLQLLLLLHALVSAAVTSSWCRSLLLSFGCWLRFLLYCLQVFCLEALFVSCIIEDVLQALEASRGHGDWSIPDLLATKSWMQALTAWGNLPSKKSFTSASVPKPSVSRRLPITCDMETLYLMNATFPVSGKDCRSILPELCCGACMAPAGDIACDAGCGRKPR